ncbi:hypothetical protein ES703_35099 [subsurface metagenome]
MFCSRTVGLCEYVVNPAILLDRRLLGSASTFREIFRAACSLYAFDCLDVFLSREKKRQACSGLSLRDLKRGGKVAGVGV